MIKLEKLNRKEAVRYLGGAKVEMNDWMESLLDECEELVIQNAQPRVIYKEHDLPWPEIMQGKDIEKHLEGCRKAILVGATLGGEIDRLLRVCQVEDMKKAVVIDVLASTAIEQVCSQLDDELAKKYPDSYLTFRFSPGYGDFPIEMQRTLLHMLDAPRKIGLTLNDSLLMVPTKSETAVLGISDGQLKRGRRGCATCNMNGQCQFRKNGEHCGF